MTGRRTTTIIAALGVTGMLLTTTGCGKVADKASEKVAEKTIESQTGGSVDLDSSNGKMKIKTKDGEYSYTDGGVTAKTKDGSATYGDNAKVPDGWPSDVEIPKGLKIGASSTQKADGGTEYLVSGTLGKGKAKSTYSSLSSSLKSNGYTLSDPAELTAGTGFTGTVTATKGNRKVSVMVNDTGDGTYVMLTIDPNT